MAFHAVAPHIPITPALDPLWLMLFAFAFFGSAALTQRRPAFGAALLAFVTPFALAHAVSGTTVTLGKAVLLGVIAGLCASGRPVPALPRAVLAAFAAIVAVDAATLAVARYPADAVRESLKWLEYAAYFAAVYAAYALDPQPRLLRAALAFSFLAAAFSALAELAIGADSALVVGTHVLPRIAGTLEGPNQLGGYLEVIVAAFAAWQVRAASASRALLLALAGIVLALCFSRAALLGVAVVLAVIAIVERRRIAAAWTVIAGAAAGYVLALLATRGLPAGALLAAVAGERASDVNAALAGGVGTRSELWRVALFFFKAHPLLGIGAGNYQYELGDAGLFGVRTQANNWYLQALAEGGILLLAATVAWLVSVLRALIANARRSAWSLGALAATCAMIVHGFSDDLVFYPKVAETWMVLIALGCAGAPDGA